MFQHRILFDTIMMIEAERAISDSTCHNAGASIKETVLSTAKPTPRDGTLFSMALPGKGERGEEERGEIDRETLNPCCFRGGTDHPEWRKHRFHFSHRNAAVFTP